MAIRFINESELLFIPVNLLPVDPQADTFIPRPYDGDLASVPRERWIGETWGVAWGDIDHDGAPDLYATNHSWTPEYLFYNNGEGTDFHVRLFDDLSERDPHGVAFADFNRDGDLDLFEAGGGGGGSPLKAGNANSLFLNESGNFVNVATKMNISEPVNRARDGIWIDVDYDGNLDLAVGAAANSTGLSKFNLYVIENNFTFINRSDLLPSDDLPLGVWQAVPSDINRDGYLDLVTPKGIWAGDGKGFRDVIGFVGDPTFAAKRLVADFNNDLLPDIFVSRGGRKHEASLLEPTTLRTYTLVQTDDPGTTVHFRSDGDVTFDFTNSNRFAAHCITYSDGGVADSKRITLSPTEALGGRTALAEFAADTVVHIRYDEALDMWELLTASKNGERPGAVQALITSTSMISDVALTPSPLRIEGYLDDNIYFNRGDGTFEKTIFETTDGGRLRAPTRNAVAADFDNDGDVDIYAQIGGWTSDLADIIYANQGDGTFIVDDSGELGDNIRGSDWSAAAADYNLDGYVDLVLSKGGGKDELNVGGTYELLRNSGSGNGWIQIDLTGVEANPHGIGAQVYVTANGETQLREAVNGPQWGAQSHSRLHFGLAEAAAIDEIRVVWPGGREQTLVDVPINQILEIVEDTSAPGPIERGARLYAINAGGPAVEGYAPPDDAILDAAFLDLGPLDFVADDPRSPHLVAGGIRKGGSEATFVSNVPGGPAPEDDPVLLTGRFDAPAGADMLWEFDVGPDATVFVDLYFAEIWTGAAAPGARVFDVNLEGGPVELDDFDVYAAAGNQAERLVVETFEATVAADGILDILFTGEVQNPKVAAIVVRTPPPEEVVPAADGEAPPTLDAAADLLLA